ncbi:MAG: glycosyltransferase family 4 protein [Candidatus Melainabacteria bacterium]|nr:glycosyltransferase family 4 protein [Candidatus Melainabacteria bacterium]
MKSQMKLLVISSEFPSMFGGVSDYTFYLSKAFASKDIKVFVLTSDNKGVKVCDFCKVLPLINKWNIFNLPKIFSVIKEFNPDIVSFQYVPYGYNNFGIPLWIILFSTLIILKRINLITTYHEIAIKLDYNPKSFFISILQRLIAFILALASIKIIVTIEYSKRLLFPFKKKIIKIPAGSIVFPVLVSESKKKELRKKLSLKSEIVVSTFGTIASYRKYDVLLMAIKKVSEENQSLFIKLIFIGKVDKHQENILEGLINNLNLNSSVYFTGYLTPEEVYKYLSISDIFVSLSTDDRGGTGIKSSSVAAAFASGLPVIGTKGLLTDDFFIEEENIYFAKSLTIRDVADALVKVIYDKDLRIKISNGAKDTYMKKLTWNNIASEYIKVFKRFEITQ